MTELNVPNLEPLENLNLDLVESSLSIWWFLG